MSNKITVYEKPTCTTCRNLGQLFRENGIEYDKVNYFTDPLSKDDLRKLLKKVGLQPYDVVRTKEPEYKTLGLSSDTPDDEVIDAIVKHPNLLQRPIVEVGDKAVLARPAEKALELLDNRS